MEAMRDNCRKRKIQSVDWFLEKIVQIYEMILVRHGLMIVGDPLAGVLIQVILFRLIFFDYISLCTFYYCF